VALGASRQTNCVRRNQFLSKLLIPVGIWLLLTLIQEVFRDFSLLEIRESRSGDKVFLSPRFATRDRRFASRELKQKKIKKNL